MSKKKGESGRKVRVDFRQNRQQRRRSDDWTRQYATDSEGVEDSHRSESVRAKGALSRKRTIIVGEDGARLIDESTLRLGTVVTIQGTSAFVDDEQGRQWRCSVSRILRTMQIDQRASVTVGDRVWFSEDPKSTEASPEGVIERVGPRTTALSRREGRERRGREHVLVANADQLLIVASVGEPKLKPHLIDRYLVAAHKGDLTPIVCFNKSDLLTAGDLGQYETEADEEIEGDENDEDAEYFEVDESSPLVIFDELSSIGYRCIWTSAKTGQGIDELRTSLAGHVTVLSGQSGVGKSSLINAVQPGLALHTQDVSTDTQKGKHTTTHARLMRLLTGGYVVDTPGIRAFDFWNVDPGELEALFIEFVPFVAKCRFASCTHRTEEGCAIRAAVDAGELSERRYSSYRKMFDETLTSER